MNIRLELAKRVGKNVLLEIKEADEPFIGKLRLVGNEHAFFDTRGCVSGGGGGCGDANDHVRIDRIISVDDF